MARHCDRQRLRNTLTALLGLAALTLLGAGLLTLVPQVTHAAAPPTGPRLDAHGDPLPDGAIARLGSLRLRHGEFVRQVMFLDGGKTLVSVSGGVVKFWEVKTGKLVRTLHGWALSPDGKSITVSEFGRGWRMLDASTLVERCQIQTEGALTFSPDCRVVANYRTYGQPIHIWDATTGRLKCHLEASSRDAHPVMFSSDMKRVAFGTGKGTIGICDADTGKTKHLLNAHKGYVGGLEFSPNSKVLASIGFDRTLCFWDVETGTELQRTQQVGGFLSIGGFIEAGTQFVTGGGEGIIRVWDVTTAKEVRRFEINRTGIFLNVAPDGVTAAIWSGIVIRFIDLLTGKLRDLSSGHDGDIVNIAISQDGKLIATGASDHIRVWDASKGTEMGTLEGRMRAMITGMAFSPDGNTIVACCNFGDVCIWDVPAKKLRLRFQGSSGEPLGRSALSADGKYVVIGGGFTVRFASIFRVEDGERVQHLEGYEGWIESVAFSPDGKLLAVGYQDLKKRRDGGSGPPIGLLRLYDLERGTEIGNVTGHYQHAIGRPVVFSPNGAMFTTSGENSDSVILYETATLTKRDEWIIPTNSTIRPKDTAITQIAFSGDGRLLGIIRERELRIWDVNAGMERTWLGLNRIQANKVAFFHNRYLASEFAGTCLLWDLNCLRNREDREIPIPKTEMVSLWNALSKTDGSSAFRAMRQLWASPQQALDLFAHALTPRIIPEETRNRIDRLIASLDSDNFDTRTKASKDLSAIGAIAAPSLRKILAKTTSVEVRRRSKNLLEGKCNDARSSEDLRCLRAIEVLEGIGSNDAFELLKKLATGTPGFLSTDASSAAVARLTRHRKSK